MREKEQGYIMLYEMLFGKGSIQGGGALKVLLSGYGLRHCRRIVDSDQGFRRRFKIRLLCEPQNAFFVGNSCVCVCVCFNSSTNVEYMRSFSFP